MGKRVVPHFLFEEILGEEGLHACLYLLAIDMEMEPLPGLRVRVVGDRLRRLPDGAGHEHAPMVPVDREDRDGDLRHLRGRGGRQGSRGHAPHDPQAPDRSCRRARLHDQDRVRARVLPVPGLLPRRGRTRLPRCVPARRTSWTTTCSRPPATSGSSARSATRCSGRIPVEFSKGEFGQGQQEINITYSDALSNADHHALYKHGVKEIAELNGSPPRSWPSGRWPRPARAVTCTRACGTPTGPRA